MRWQRRGRSANLEDRRGRAGLPGGGRLGLGGVVVLLLLAVVFRQDLGSILGAAGSGALAGPTGPVASTAEEEELVDFVSFVLDDAQEVWSRLFAEGAATYRDAQLVLFRDATSSGCGYAQSASGPFYCPADGKVYIDLSFYEELSRRFGAPGDFAQAYVLAHEIGHHVQTLLGTEADVRRLQQANPGMANDLSVRLELQADCLAGVWAYSTARRELLERGDVDEALGAASAVGDDRIQRETTGRIHPESFTHGTSSQRMQWFRRGLESGRPDACDTFTGA